MPVETVEIRGIGIRIFRFSVHS